MKHFVFFFVALISVAKAQQVDSTLLFVSTATEEKLNIQNSTQKTDTSLDNQQNYYQTGVLGNIGLPSYSLLAADQTQGGFFNWMNLNNRNDLFTNKQPVYFYPRGKIYTKVFAVMGQKLEQVFKITHSQNIKRVNISVQFNRYSCAGFYKLQKTITDNLIFSSHSTTKSGRVGYNFYFLYNKLKYQLNGGFDTNRVDFEKNVLVDKQLFPLNLSTARQNLRTSEANLELFVKLNKDSSSTSHHLICETNYQANYWFYADGFADSAFYRRTDFYATNGANKDSVSFKRFSNSFLYKVNASDKFIFYAGYKNEFNHYSQFFIDTMGMNHMVMAGTKIKAGNHLLAGNGEYVVSGYNIANYQVQGDYKFSLKKFFLAAQAHAKNAMPDYMSMRYYAPHFTWLNNFSNIQTQNVKAELGSNQYRFTLGAFMQTQQNQIYFDTLALPQQYKGTTSIIRAFAQKDLKLGPLHFNNILNYQSTANTDIIRLPKYYTFHQLYYEGKLFKKKLWLQVGFQARYISAFKANAYMPATNQFYLQNAKEYGNYVFVDFFLNAQIERFRFFLMASHINQGISGGNYVLCPTYSMPDRSIKAGLTWMFFD